MFVHYLLKDVKVVGMGQIEGGTKFQWIDDGVALSRARNVVKFNASKVQS